MNSTTDTATKAFIPANISYLYKVELMANSYVMDTRKLKNNSAPNFLKNRRLFFCVQLQLQLYSVEDLISTIFFLMHQIHGSGSDMKKNRGPIIMIIKF